MTPHQIVAVALRLFSVWLGIASLKTVPAFFTLNGFHAPNYVWMSFLLGLTIIIILALWFFPSLIAEKLVPRSNANTQSSPTPEVWLALGCTLLGLWIFVTTLPHFVLDFITLNALEGFEDRSQLRDWVLYYAVELAVSVWLLLGGKGVQRLFRWTQYAGTRKDL